MNLVPLDFDAIRLGHPLPFPLRTRDGTLLAEKGLMVSSKASLRALIGPGIGLYLDIDESEDASKPASADHPGPPVAARNLTPADVYFGRGETILAERRRIKLKTIQNRRLNHQRQAA